MTTSDITFEAVYAVPLECQSCVDSVKHRLDKLDGIRKLNIDLARQLVVVEGFIAPSSVIRAIQESGRDAIIRGTGNPNSAAVCILESFDQKDYQQPVKGLARIVKVNENEVVIDVTLNGLAKGIYFPSFRTSGDLSGGALSTGALFHDLGAVEVDEPSSYTTRLPSLGAVSETTGLFSGQAFLRAPLKITDLIGRSMVLSPSATEVTTDSLCGVIARSAGVWENDKQVCSCTGKTVWQERSDALDKGITV